MTRLNQAPRARRGGALVMTMVCIASLATASLALIAISLAASNEQRDTRERIHTRYMAEAALNVSVAALRSGGDGVIGSELAPVVFDGTAYWVDCTAPSADLRDVTATAIDDRSASRMEMTLQRTFDSMWKWAAFGQDRIHLDSSARTDSYRSLDGTYASQVSGSGGDAHALGDGDIGTNGSIAMDSNTQVWGDALSGPTGTVTLNDNAKVSGSTNPMAEPVTLPELVAPTFPSSGNKTVNGNFNIPAGDRAYDTLRLNSGASVKVTGPANIVFTNFEMGSNTEFLCDTTKGPVRIWVLDNFILDSNALLTANNHSPADLEFNLLSDNVVDPGITIKLDTVSISSNSVMYGTIYAPNAKMRLDSNFELFGSMMARNIDMDSNSKVHYDESLATLKTDGVVLWQKLAWREVPYRPGQAETVQVMLATQ